MPQPCHHCAATLFALVAALQLALLGAAGVRGYEGYDSRIKVPSAAGSFQAGTLIITQESLTDAPLRYPTVQQFIDNTTREAAGTPLPDQDSGNMDLCEAPKWQAIGSKATKTVT